MKLMKKAVETGAPINPPIWWVAPSSIEAYKINDGKNNTSFFLRILITNSRSFSKSINMFITPMLSMI